MQIDRKQFLEELALREHIREAIKFVTEKRQQELDEETQLRGIIREMYLQEKAAEVPHESTGINFLRTLLKKIVPVLEDDYRQLTTSKEQRESFSAHILNATQNTLNTQLVDDEVPLEEQEDEIAVRVGDDDKGEKFIDIEPEEEDPEDAEIEEFGIEGEDKTGRNMAYTTFNKIEQNIIDTFTELGGAEDQENFYEYLLTNLKMHFNDFEDELQTIVPEPDTGAEEAEIEAAATGEEELGF
tara:strand:+ start:56 stop:781 length:726 start_codon:yes stop_codon:yes gene_type:complete